MAFLIDRFADFTSGFEENFLIKFVENETTVTLIQYKINSFAILIKGLDKTGEI